MAEWNQPGLDRPVRSVRTPDAIVSIAQMRRMLAVTPRPFVLITERELSVLRRGLTKDGWKRALYLQPARQCHGLKVGPGMLSVANRWLDTEISIPGQAGHLHDYFCDCGERLSEPDGLEISDCYHCPVCGKTYSGPDFDGAVLYLQHNNLAGAALSLAIVHGIEKDRAYAAKTATILLEYARAYPGPHTHPCSGGMFVQSLDEAAWVIALAQAYDLIYYSRCIGEEAKEDIEQRLFRVVAEGLMSLPVQGHWGAWQLSAIGIIGLAIKDPLLVKYALDALEQQLTEHLGLDGLWPESVHTFHFYALSAYVHLAEGCYRAGIDIYNWEPAPGRSLKAMFAAPLEYAYPSFVLPAIHDGWFTSVLPLDLYEIAYRRWGDPSFGWVLKRGYKFGESPINNFQVEHRQLFSRASCYAFLFGRDLPGRLGPTILSGRDFGDLGICAMRGSDDMMVTFDYGRFLDHGHLDKLGFTLFAHGSVAMPDFGTPGFGSEMTRWCRSTAGHNTVVVDGSDQQESRKSGLMHRYAGSYLQFAEGFADDCYPGVSHARRMIVVGGTCIVADQLTSASEHDYDWLVRCLGEAEIATRAADVDLDMSGYSPAKMDRAMALEEKCRLRWRCENGDIDFSIWPEDAPAAAAVGSCPSNTVSRVASFFLCRQRARSARFLAVAVAVGRDAVAKISRDAAIMEIQVGSRVDHVYIEGHGTKSSSSSLQTDAEIAAVRVIDGNVVSVAMAKGSWVSWKGHTLVECPSVVDGMEFVLEDHGPVIRYLCDTAGVMKVRTNARAMRVNGFRANATRSEGAALVRITPQMIPGDMG